MIKNLVFLLAIFSFHFLQAQTKEVTGNVKDENGEPLPGVTIVIQDSDLKVLGLV